MEILMFLGFLIPVFGLANMIPFESPLPAIVGLIVGALLLPWCNAYAKHIPQAPTTATAIVVEVDAATTTNE